MPPLEKSLKGTFLVAQRLRLHLLSNAEGVGLILGQEAKIPHISWPKNQNVKQKRTSLVDQQLRIPPANASVTGLSPGLERYHMPQDN